MPFLFCLSAGWFKSDDMLVSRLATGDLAVTGKFPIISFMAFDEASFPCTQPLTDVQLQSLLVRVGFPLAELALLAAEYADDPQALKATLAARQKAEAQAKKAEAKIIICETFSSAC